MHNIFFILFLILNQMTQAQITTGVWRAELETPGGPLPFNFEISLTTNGYAFALHNGDELLSTAEVTVDDNTLYVNLPVFNSSINAEISSDYNNLSGWFHDYSRGSKYAIPFTAKAGESYRFMKNPDSAQFNISGKWNTQFKTADQSYQAVGVFTQTGNLLNGTFLTATGDYRYLQGDVSGNQFFLSTFDGAHAFLFTGNIENDSTLSGKFFSGNHWQETFSADKNDTIQLPDPNTLTYLKDGYDSFNFCFPTATGDTICSSDKQFQNKVVIIQVMGTWCPNCMDETAYLAELFQKYNSQGLEIVALAFEKETDQTAASKNFGRLRKQFGITYPILLAGSSKKLEASNALPMLNAVIAYPTLIVLDRNKQVVFIHTGFNGPATGDLYSAFSKEFQQKIQQLLN